MKENPKERLYDDKNPETFLTLNNLLICDYCYTVSTDLHKDLNKQLLMKEMYQNLTNQIQKQ